MSRSLDCFSFEFKILLLSYILAFSQKQKEVRKDTQVFWVTYFSRTGYFLLVLSPCILSCEELNGAHLDFTKSTKPRDGPLGDLWPIGHRMESLPESCRNFKFKATSKLQSIEETRAKKKNLRKYLWFMTLEFTLNIIYTASWIPLWHLFSLSALDMTKRLWKDQYMT